MSQTIHARRISAGPAPRVEVEVADAPVWFDSNLPLVLTPDAIVAAFLLVCAHNERGMTVDAPLTARFNENLKQLSPIFHDFWKYEPVPLVEPLGEDRPPPGSLATPFKSAALMFSGGVDSFYSLLRGSVLPSALVMVEGFDIPLTQPARTAAAWNSLAIVASHLGLQPVKVTTNLREHTLFRTLDWEVSHGGALAAVGHLLAEHFSHLLISSSNSYRDATKPWGSHFRIDPLWSSDSMAILHVGATHRRSDKLIAIADEPLVQHNLRVCWEGNSSRMNCGTCEKCLRTQLVLYAAGKLDRFTTFEGDASTLLQTVRSLPFVKNRLTLAGTYARFAESNSSSELGREVAKLIRRSNHQHIRRALGKSLVGRSLSRLLR